MNLCDRNFEYEYLASPDPGGVWPPSPPLAALDRAFLIGIGGVGMSAIAAALLARGLRISGSDARENDFTGMARARGARVCIGHAAANLADAAGVVVSSAIKEDNPELREARRRGLPVWHRSQALQALMDVSRSVGVAGCHGKTTTTLMTGAVLEAAGMNPTVLVGGWVPEYKGSARIGAADLVVAEVDESDGSFINIRPRVSIVTNVDFDHPDHFADMDQVRAEFVNYINQTPADGAVVLDADDAGTAPIVSRLIPPVLRCSLHDSAADLYGRIVSLGAGEARFEVRWRGRDCGVAHLNVGGAHNVKNAMLALAAGLWLGADASLCLAGLEAFRGVRRRFELRGRARGISIYDDYAHHPREVAATLSVAAKAREEKGGRVWAIFQPHRYTRTQALFSEFGAAFGDADAVIVTDVYAAGDEAIPGVSGALVADAIRRAGHPDVAYCPRLQDVCDRIVPLAREGDLILTLGAGDITGLGPMLLQGLEPQECKMRNEKKLM
ncbi:MAG: UDP-N-acetylmuramate--L-alanine ligase [Candidatus Sumerlaeota bacterium]|nr:UDP-N-acetylmuramate--L-alanine ligase [Candidatus Sumerlaeota bacterium]